MPVDYFATLIVLAAMGLLPIADLFGYVFGHPLMFAFKVAIAIVVFYLIRKFLELLLVRRD